MTYKKGQLVRMEFEHNGMSVPNDTQTKALMLEPGDLGVLLCDEEDGEGDTIWGFKLHVYVQRLKEKAWIPVRVIRHV